MSDLQCPARFLLVTDDESGVADHVLTDADDPWAELEALADTRRGETVVVRVAEELVGRLPRMLRPPAHVEVDADGWRSLPPS